MRHYLQPYRRFFIHGALCAALILGGLAFLFIRAGFWTDSRPQDAFFVPHAASRTFPPHAESYPALMRQTRVLSPRAFAPGREPAPAEVVVVSERELFADQLATFSQAENDYLKNLGVSRSKRRAYQNLLEQQQESLAPAPPSKLKTLFSAAVSAFGFGQGTGESAGEPTAATEPLLPLDAKLPPKPASFQFQEQGVIVRPITISKPTSYRAPVLENTGNKTRLSSLFGISPVHAYTSDQLPTLADIQTVVADSNLAITPAIQDLAADLEYNPVAIYNHIREHISYEPYYGAKKGAAGCLAEKACNDVDTASLAIALLRASGIPARYHKSLATVPALTLKNLLGVDEVKTAYYALKANNVPVYVTSGAVGDIDSVNLENEQELVVEWIFAEAFYEYDERGANISNAQNLETVSSFQTDEALRAYLAQYPKKQWIPIEPLINRRHTRVQNEIVADTAGFDAQSFWFSFFQEQGDASPVEKYRADLLSAVSKDILEPQYQSSNSIAPHVDFDILPPSLPYAVGPGTDSEGAVILPETWSILPDSRWSKVIISLLSEDSQTTILSRTFFASETNNQPITLSYAGKTQTDADVIASYGGVHATPSPLVDIVPYLTIGATHYGTEAAVSIGDTLILQFSYQEKGQRIYEDQKFSIAGNEEGIFISFGTIPPNYLFDDASLSDEQRNSRILLEGNTALAREYLKHIQEQGTLLSKSLDYSFQTQFSRAVVTQNRILSKLEGTPTTFDFSGLTIDASAYINDYSNRGNYKEHRQDFRLLWGLEASHYEGRLFKDIAGLDGISTVKGLQYAHAHPETYTVHTITSANESDIDALSLSANTKANLHADVQAGNTIITPDRPITKGAFTGILYVSAADNGTGRYAIGEQVSNGGWTTEGYEIRTVFVDGIYIDQFINQGEPDNFIYANESSNASDKMCRISETVFTDIILNENWQEAYGLPCLREDITFGDPADASNQHQHTFLLALNAAKFVSASANAPYSFWQIEQDALAKARQKLPDERLNSSNTYAYWGTYVFSKHSPTENKQNKINTLAIYNPADQNVYVLKDNIAQKYISSNTITERYVPHLLGFPTSDQQNAAKSFADTSGKYQNFTTGQIYFKDSFLPWRRGTFVVFGNMAGYYNSDENMRNGQRGTGGVFGFPIGDPFKQGSDIAQKFEEVNLGYNIVNGIIVVSSQTKDERRLQNKGFAQVKLKEVINGQLTDVEVFAQISDYIANRTINTDEFMRDIVKLFVNVDEIRNIPFGWKQAKKFLSRIVPINEPFTIAGFSDTGFKFNYNDSHYCLEGSCTSNQIYHAMAGFDLGYLLGKQEADKKTLEHDRNPSALGTRGHSMEDINLSFKMSEIGEQLKNGGKARYDVGSWIMNNLAIKDDDGKIIADQIRITRQEIERLTSYRIKFRGYEREQIGEVQYDGYKLLYSADMQIINCRDKENYYQDYLIFGEQLLSKAVINNNSVFLIPRKILEEYNLNGGVCGSLGLPTGEFDSTTRSQKFEHGILTY